MDKHRIVITGVGAITPLGMDVETTWENLLQGKSGVKEIDLKDGDDFPVKVAATILDFDPQDYMDRKTARRTARFTQFAVAAAQAAVKNAGLEIDAEDPTRVGIEIGSAIGAVDQIAKETRNLDKRGARRVNPLLVPLVMINAAACQTAVELGTTGPTNAPVAACATGTYAIGQAMHRLQRGDVDVMVAGGTEACIGPLGAAAFARIGALSSHEDSDACRPFDVNRDGTVMAEGAAVMVLETLEHALARGATILAEVVGYGQSEDAYHITAPDPEAKGARRAITMALADAELSPDAVDYIAAHGTGTPLNDTTETLAIKRALGEHAEKVAISSNKSMLGHMFGAAGAISAIASVLAIRDNVLPPTMNLYEPDPECDLDYVPLQARESQVNVAMSNAFGFGGQNGSLLVRRFTG